MRIRAFIIVAAVVLTASGCTSSTSTSDEPSSGVSTLTSSDESLRVDVPVGWEAMPEKQQGTAVLVAQGSEPVDQLIVTREAGRSDAYDNALFIVTGLTADGADCQPGSIDGHQSFDCADETDGQSFHRVFVSVEADDDDESYALLVQTAAGSADDVRAVVTPIVESIDLRGGATG